jgi:prevent-host-death family protein
MKTITVREMKAHWSEVEKQVANGEIIEVLNHGKPRVRLVPAGGHRQVVWDDHLATAIPNKGVSVTETVARDRGGRW